MKAVSEIRGAIASTQRAIDNERLYRDTRDGDTMRALIGDLGQLRAELIRAATFDQLESDRERDAWVVDRNIHAGAWLSDRLARAYECEDLRARVTSLRKELREAREEIGRLKYPTASEVQP